MRGKIGVAPVEGETMDSFGGSFEKGNLSRLGTIRYVEDLQPALRFISCFVALVIDEHDVSAYTDFVRMNPRRHFELSNEFGMLGILDVDDGRSMRRLNVADVGIAVFDDYRTSAGKIHSADLLDFLTYADW